MTGQKNNEEQIWGLLDSAFSNDISIGLDLETIVEVLVVDDDAPIDDTQMIDIFYTRKDFLSVAGLFEEPETPELTPKLTLRKSVALQAKEYLIEYSAKTDGWYQDNLARYPNRIVSQLINYTERVKPSEEILDELSEDSLFVTPIFMVLYVNFNYMTQMFSSDAIIPMDTLTVLQKASVITYYYSILSCIFPDLPRILTTNDTTREYFRPIAKIIEKRERQDLNRRLLTSEALFFLGYMTKPYLQEHVMTWLDKRLSALHKNLAASSKPRSRSRTALVVYEYWQAAQAVRPILMTHLLDANIRVSDSMKLLSEDLRKQVKMILEWAELRLYRASYLYVTGHNPALLTNLEFSTQAAYLVKTYEKHNEELKELHPFGRLLGKIGDEADIAKYPDVALSTLYFMQSQTESWKNFTEPSAANATISRTLLKANCNKFLGLQSIEELTPNVEANLKVIHKNPDLFKAALQATKDRQTNPVFQQMEAMRELFKQFASQEQ